MQALLYTPFSRKKAFPPRSAGPGGLFCACPRKTSPSRLRRATSPNEGRPWHTGKPRLFARGSPTRGNGDDRRQWRKQGGAVGAAASRMQATAKQTLGAATRPWRAKQTERLYGGKPVRERKPLPRGEPSDLHDSAPLRWNKWRSSYKLNDTSLNIGCLPRWQSSPDWQTTYFASWVQLCHLGKVRFTALVR